MKIFKIVLLSLIATCSLKAATTSYTFTTGTTDTSNGIRNSSGVAFQGGSPSSPSFAGPGVIGVGFFTISDAQISAATTASTLTSAFNNWNTSGTSTFAAAGPGGNRGTFNFNPAARDLTLAGGSDFAGKNMYVFVGNGTTFANSTEFLVLKSTFTFNSAETGTSFFTKQFTTGNSTALFGSQVTNVFTTNADTSTTPGWQTAAVPEPSVALLGALGGLMLLRRRR